MQVRFEHSVRISLFTLGFSSLFTQVFLLRECFTILNGNELVIGIVLANWVLLTGAGAWLGRFFGKMKGKIPFLLFLQFLFSLLPLLMLLKLDLWKAVSIPAGSMPGLDTIIGSTFLIQLPFCLLNGFLFIVFVHLLAEITRTNASARSYAIESVGGMMAGLLVNIFLFTSSSPFFSLRILLVMNLLVCLLAAFMSGIRPVRVIMGPVYLLFMIVPFFADLETWSLDLLYPGQKIISHHATPYGNVDVTMNAGQINYYENGLLLFSSGNEIFNEECVHFAMVQNLHPEKVMLISGGISGTIKEILKYHPVRIDYIELDPGLITAGKRYSKNLDNPAIRVIQGDARRFVRTANEKYDVVLINLPEPSTLLLNRYYSLEFLRELRPILAAGAVVSVSLPSTADYVSKTAVKTNSILYHTIRLVFPHVIILPGQRNYFLASDSTLSTKINSLTAKRGISNKYVNAFYLDENSLKDRSEYVMSQLEKTPDTNGDFRPLAFFMQIQYWISMFRWNMLVYGIVILALILLIFFSLNRISLGLFTGGFTASSIEILILISFQIIYGYIFLVTGMIITLFMAGLAAGAFSYRRIYDKPSVKKYIHLQVTLALFSLGFPFIILAMNLPGIPVPLVHAIFILLTLIVSFITGLLFSMASAIGGKNITTSAASNYSADLFGSAIGAIVTTIILLPLLGLVITCLILFILNLFSAGFLAWRGNQMVKW
jgi:spermidine synthase